MSKDECFAKEAIRMIIYVLIHLGFIAFTTYILWKDRCLIVLLCRACCFKDVQAFTYK